MSSGLRHALGWGAVQTAVRLTLSFVSIKVTAVYLGAPGLALVGQVGNFIALVQGVFANAVSTAVVRMTAERENDGALVSLPIWGTAVRLVALLGIGVGVLVGLTSLPLARWLFGSADLWPVLALVGVVLPFGMLSQVLNGILTGQKQFRLIALCNIGIAVSGAAVFIGGSYWFGLLGGLVGATLACGVGVPVTFAVVRCTRAFAFKSFIMLWRRELLRPIVAFYPMLLVHAAAAPLTLLLVRDALIGSVGVEQAGLWQAGLRLSDMYTGVLLTALGMYSLPTLSAIREPADFRRELFGMVAKMGAITALIAGTLFVLRDLVVRIVFTAEFTPVRDLLAFQLIGDVLNLAAWPMRSALMAQQRPRTYMAVEAGIGIGQVVLTYIYLPALGVKCAPVAYATAWAAAFVTLLALHRKTRVNPQIAA